MGRAPCCDKAKVKRGPWSPEEDATLKSYLHSHGTGGNWIALPAKAGLKRCGKSCRLRWLNYLRPDIKHGGFTPEEDLIICTYHSQIGSRWSVIASQLPGRTDNDVKNYWNTKLKKKLLAGNINNLNNNNNNSSRAVGDSVSSMLSNYSSSSSSSSPLLLSRVVPKNEPFFISPAAATTDEHIHFSSWYGLNSLPDYSNNYHSDLYRPVLPPSDHIVPPQIEAIGISREDTVNVVSQEGSCISSDSSSLPALPIDQDFGFGAFSYDIWYPNMADLTVNNSYVDIKTQELLDRSHHQVTNQY